MRLCCILLPFTHLNFILCIEEYAEYNFRLLVSGKVTTSIYIFQNRNESHSVSCARRCVEQADCVSYFHEKLTRNCQLVSKTFAVSELQTSAVGWRYFIPKGSEQPPLTTTSQPETTNLDPSTTSENEMMTTISMDTTTSLEETTSPSSPTTVLATCPFDMVKFGSSCYKMYTSEWRSWASAKAFCEGMGYYLVEITSQDENNFVVGEMTRLASGWLWLGGTDEVSEGTFKWVHSGENIGFHDFANTQPDNEGGIENYLAIADGTYSDPYKWLDVANLPEKNVMCEKEL